MVAAILMLGIVSVSEAQAYTAGKPYITVGHYTAKVTINFKDNCWKEAYLRMANRDNNHILLNKHVLLQYTKFGTK